MLWIETSWSIFTFWKWLFPDFFRLQPRAPAPSSPTSARTGCASTSWTPNATASTTAPTSRTRLPVVGRDINIFTLSKAAKGGSNIVTVTQTDNKSAAHWAVCWKRAPGLDSFIYFIFLWELLLSSLKVLFLTPFKPGGLIVVFHFTLFFFFKFLIC